MIVTVTPELLFSNLSDETRMRSLMLILAEDELCVCELTFALEESQPKISRHLALMREAGLVTARRDGIWMHYRISTELPAWTHSILEQVYRHLKPLDPFPGDRRRLRSMSDRPGVNACA